MFPNYFGANYKSNHVALSKDQQDVFNIVVATLVQPQINPNTSIFVEGPTGTGKE